MAEGAHIGTLGALHPQEGVARGGLAQKLQGVNVDAPGLALHLLALTGQLIELLSLDFNSGVHGRKLLQVPGEPLQQVRELLPRRGDGVFLQDFPAGILGIGDNAQFYTDYIFLSGLCSELHRPRSPAHKDR